jgi:hypothetical protein
LGANCKIDEHSTSAFFVLPVCLDFFGIVFEERTSAVTFSSENKCAIEISISISIFN